MARTVFPEAFAASSNTQEKKKQRSQQLLTIVIMAATIFALLPLVLQAPRPAFVVPSTAVLILSTFFLFPLAVYLSVIWHELGHLLAGRLMGFRFVLVTFGPLRIAREAGGLRLSLINNNILQWQGRALSIPLDYGDHRGKRIILLAGGPLATLSQLLLLLGLNSALRSQVLPFGWGLMLLWLLLAAVMLLPATAIPQKIGQIHTDAARIWQLWRGGKSVQNQLALNNLVAASLRGEPPDRLDQSCLDRLMAAPPDSGEALFGHYLAHIRALETGNIENAAAFLDQTLTLLQHQPPAGRSPVIFTTAAYFAARYEDDLPQAAAWLALVKPVPYNPLALEVEQILLRVRAQIFWQSGEPGLARAAAQKSLELLERSVDLGSVASEKRLLGEILVDTAGVIEVPELPEALQPVVDRRRPFMIASSRGVLRLAFIVIVGLLLGLALGELIPDRAVDAYQRGVAHLENGEFAAAVPDFDRAIALDAQFAQAYWGRGDALMSLGRYETAVADFTQVIDLHPTTFPSIYLYRAAAYTELGDFPAAIADYRSLLELDPDEALRQLALDSIHILETAE